MSASTIEILPPIQGKELSTDLVPSTLSGHSSSTADREPKHSRLGAILSRDSRQHDPDRQQIRKLDFGFLPIPPNRRHHPSKKVGDESEFTWRLNLLFACAATVSVMNLYYIQPMLVAVADSFEVSHDAVSRIPILAQGGYGCGILFISPLGDLVRRRQLVLLLMFFTTCLSIGLALSRNVNMLSGLSFVVGFFTITPQIVIPWTADLAPLRRRATAMSVTLSGLIVGLVVGRTLSGIISLASWRYSYWMAIGLQGLMLIILWLCLPDTPGKKIGLTYPQVLWSMAKMYTKYPTLVQACFQSYTTSAVFAGLWTTLTFLLSDSPYQYSTLEIGLFGLLGLVGALLSPIWGHLIDQFHPYLAQLVGIWICMISMIIGLTAAKINVGAVCVAIAFYDVGQQLNQLGNGYRVAGIDPNARARLNGCNLLALFAGQTSGTAIMTKIYNSHGWQPTAGTAIAFLGVGILTLLVRGPHEIGWIGWNGGWKVLKKEKMSDTSANAVTEKLKSKTKKGQSVKPVEGPIEGEKNV
ncbi:membrane protein [Cryptococcus bacillisporus CA1873]|uniref:Membrane protein n=1 Tax=Cryptococcus bacillisporus CA1873 TaxID=1296111 RepID=A0ABR5B8M3_CRYGA|nr:membrane protein [Cryptococcus bacillisporus CA1873]|eukprot:KIR59883.1 membrane protein [Cryptococcus gattii CA1873]